MGKNNDLTDSLERPGVLKEVKVVLVGPAQSGKTALIQRFVNETFSDIYIPTGFEKYSTKYKVGEYTVQYSLWDTSGSGAYDTVRPLAYQDANVFLLCFNVGDPESLDLAINKWYPEVRSHCPQTPIVLCGCRADARNNIEVISYLARAHKIPVTSEQAINASKHIAASAYVETSSAYAGLAIPETFELAAKAALGMLNVKEISKKQKKFNHSTTMLATKNNKTDIKNELKGRAKNACSIM